MKIDANTEVGKLLLVLADCLPTPEHRVRVRFLRDDNKELKKLELVFEPDPSKLQ